MVGELATLPVIVFIEDGKPDSLLRHRVSLSAVKNRCVNDIGGHCLAIIVYVITFYLETDRGGTLEEV